MDNVIHLSAFNKGICDCCIYKDYISYLNHLILSITTLYKEIFNQPENDILISFGSQLFHLVDCSISFLIYANVSSCNAFRSTVS